MTIIVYAFIIVLVAFLLCYVVDQAQVPPPTNPVLKVLIVLLAIVLIAREGGLL